MRHATCACLLSLSGLAAQTTRVVPADRTDVEGFALHQYPFSYSEVRFQQIWDGSELATVNASIYAVEFRRDGSNATPHNARSWTYTVTAYETLVSPASMTTDWINNRGGGLGTVVLSGPIHVPAASPTFPTPQPWGVMLPFQAPFPFDRNNGHFLLEIEGNDPANLFDAWPVDAENWWRTARGDSTRVSGDPCVGAGGERVTLSMPAAASLVLGGTMTVGMGGTVLPAYANWLGTSNRSYLGVPLPFDLGLVGAPGCLLGTDPALQQIGAGPFAWPIPLVPALENEVLFTQALGLAAGANPGGFVTSDVYQVRLGGASSPMSRTQTVYRRSNLSLPTGFMSAASFHGPICRFHGVFN